MSLYLEPAFYVRYHIFSIHKGVKALAFYPMYRLSDFDYKISKDLIAQSPLTRRDESRLLVLYRNSGKIEHRRFYQLVEYLRKGDLLVLNDTRVFPARLIGRRKSGGRVEILLLKEIAPSKWKAIIKAGSRLKSGDIVEFEGAILIGMVLDYLSNGEYIMSFVSRTSPFETKEDFWECLNRFGEMPLPPYIKRNRSNDLDKIADRERYQTVFAKERGAIAAPTAGLHFTKELLDEIRDIGVEVVSLTLHVGIGTFRPIKVEDIRNHVMEAEYFEVNEMTANRINRAKREARRIIAVGTTTCRVLETIANKGPIRPRSGWTDLFIFPPYKFKIVDVLITNFHQPRSTMLLMVSAFAGREQILNAYGVAREERYRFYSYGDSMVII